MKIDSTNKLNSIIGSSGILKHTQEKLAILEELNTLIQDSLNPELKAHCRVANIKKNTLILTTTSPVWKYQIRFWHYEILEAIHKDPKYKKIRAIKTKISPIDHNSLIRKASKIDLKNPTISASNAEILSNMADSISNNKLAQALKNITKHAFKKHNYKKEDL